MNTRTHGVIGIAAFLCCAAAQAATPPPPAAVTSALKAIAKECTDVGGKADTSKAIQRADLNGDGNEDYVLDVRGINCEGAASICGHHEMMVSVYVGDGKGGAKEAFSDSVFGANLERSGASAKLWMTVMGQSCGKKPAKDFASENFCDRSIVWNAKTQKFDWAPVSTVKMIQ